MRPFILALAFTSLASAQNPSEVDSPKEARSKVTFVLLGQPVRKTYTVLKGGGIDEVAAKPGEVPPSRVICKAGEAASESWLTLNVPSGSSPLKAGTTAVELQEYVESTDGKPSSAGRSIAKVPLAPGGKPQTAFLWKKDPKADWKQDLATLALPDDAAAFPARSIRVVNLSRSELFFQIGEKKIQLPVGRNTTVAAPDAVVPIIAAVRQGDGFFTAVNTGRKLRGNDRLSLVVYDYDGEREANKTPPPVAGILVSQPLVVEVSSPAPNPMASTAVK